MRVWLRSPTLLKYFVGQHIINGLSVAASVALVSLLSSSLLGFAAGQPATLGAIGASISDFPGPWRVKGRTLLIGFTLALFSTSAVLIAGQSFVGEIVAIGAIAFASGLVTGLGRWALALSMQMLVPMVFMLGLPPLDAEGLVKAELLFAAGGSLYIGLSMALTGLVERSDRRMMASECFRELGAYLRAIAKFTEPNIDLAAVYGAGMRQQAALSEQLQAARALLLTKPRKTPERVRLAATIGILLDVFDALVATVSEMPDLRKMPAAATLLRRIGVVMRAAALDLQHLSLDVLQHSRPSLPPDHSLAFDAMRREADKLLAQAELSQEDKAVVAATLRRLGVAREEVLRLEAALTDDAAAEEAIGEIDLSAFEPKRSFDPRQLGPHLQLGSPVLRYATRLALAMMSGGLVAHGLGYRGHGNWVLLSIAVILRASYGLTLQRRNDRLVGTLIGCVTAAGAVAYLPPAGLVLLQAFSLALTHSFVRLNYRLASIGASMVALISLHLVSPAGQEPVVVRLADTIVGAAIANLFSYLWPSWELAEAPRLAKALLRRAARFALIALDAGASDQDYRMARKELIEALAALSDSAARMGGEPQSTRRGLEEMAQMLIAASAFVARVSAARLDRPAFSNDENASYNSKLELDRQSVAAILGASGPSRGGPNGSASRLVAAAYALAESADLYEQAATADPASEVTL